MRTQIISNHPIHPQYGPCDALANGDCAECIRTVQDLVDQRGNLLAALKECVGYVDAVAATLSMTDESIPAATAKAAHAAIKKAGGTEPY